MGVALAPCSLPQTRRPNFNIGADEMEIGGHVDPGAASAVTVIKAMAESLRG